MLATAFVVASIVVSCRGQIGEADHLDLAHTPTQRTYDMFAVQTQNGRVSMRCHPLCRERVRTGRANIAQAVPRPPYQAVIVADNARHIVPKDRRKDEIWEAFGNVIMHNVIEQETMETDTIYWDQAKKELYTDCYVKIYSRQGFLQGFGMSSDDHVRNSILYRPFDGYGVVTQDSTAVIIDSVNFIGPFPKK